MDEAQEKPRKTRKKAAPPALVVIRVVSKANRLRDPYRNVRLVPGVPVEYERVSGWLQSQIDAGLVEVL